MLYWSQIPLLRLLIPFVLGIISAYYLTEDFSTPFAISVSFGLLLILFLLSQFVKSYRNRWIFGFSAYLLFFFWGLILCRSTLEKHKPTFLPEGREVHWIGQLSELKKQTDSSSSVEVELAYYRDSLGKWVETKEKINAYLADSSSLKVGDWISAQSYINRIEGAKNPKQFDYAEFMRKRFVYYQTFASKTVLHFHRASLSSWAAKVREDLIRNFIAAGIDGDRLAVLIAISLGDKSYLEDALKNNYAGAGAMHILAVSGLHVGIVYLIFTALFSFLKLGDRLQMRMLKGIILLIMVWGFAIITGLSPSVQRAACMFSFLIVADMVNRHSIALNSIAASAFFILLINPLMVFEIGFQLSYAAVMGIVWMHPIIYSWFNPSFWLLDKAWSLMLVSIAAQLATLPFTLYYFHQFPNWFLLTNLAVIPLAFVIVSGAIVVGLLWSLFSTAFYLNHLLEASLWLLNQFIANLRHLPFFVTEGIWISLFSALLLAASILFFAVYLQNIKAKWVLASLATLCLFLLLETAFTVKQLKQNQMVVYYVRNQSVYAVIDGLKAEVYTFNDTLDNFAGQIVLDHLKSIGVEQWKLIVPVANEQSNYLENKEHLSGLQLNKKIVLFTNGIPKKEMLKKIPKETTIVVRKGEENNAINSIQSTLNIVLDSSIPEWDYDYKELINEGEVYSVSKGGYYLIHW